MQILTHSARHLTRHNNNLFTIFLLYIDLGTHDQRRAAENGDCERWRRLAWILKLPPRHAKRSSQLAAGRSQHLSGDVATAAATVATTAKAEFQRTKLTNWLNHWLSTWLTDCMTDCLTACLPNSFAEKCLERLSKGLSSQILPQPSIQVLPILSLFAFLSSCLVLFLFCPEV